MKRKMLSLQVQEWMFNNKSNWPSAAALGLQGWMIKVNGDKQQLQYIFLCIAEGMAKWILLRTCLQLWACVKACRGSRGRAPFILILSLGVGE
jgi:hypothetical protein